MFKEIYVKKYLLLIIIISLIFSFSCSMNDNSSLSQIDEEKYLTNQEDSGNEDTIQKAQVSYIRFLSKYYVTVPGKFINHKGIAVDDKYGSLYAVDAGTDKVMRFSSTGNLLKEWGSSSNLSSPFGIAYYAGKVFVADLDNHRIKAYVFWSGKNFKNWGKFGAGNGQFYKPFDVEVSDDSGRIYVADAGNHRIQVFDKAGNFILKWGSHGYGNGQFGFPTGIAVYKGEVYVVDRNNDRIQVFDGNGKFKRKWGSYGTTKGKLNSPYGIDIDKNTGYVFISDAGNNRIQIFNKYGNSLYYLGNDHHKIKCNFNYPLGVTVNSTKKLMYVSHRSNDINVFKYDY